VIVEYEANANIASNTGQTSNILKSTTNLNKNPIINPVTFNPNGLVTSINNGGHIGLPPLPPSVDQSKLSI
jgi:hypothetical protein